MRREKDLEIISHIMEYCAQIEDTVSRFGNDYDIYRNDPIYRNAIALCIIQIGELVNKLSDEFQQEHSEIAWYQIRGMRNVITHGYGTVDPDVTWETIQVDIPKLKDFCRNI